MVADDPLDCPIPLTTPDERARALLKSIGNPMYWEDVQKVIVFTRDERRRVWKEAANWLRRQANAESNIQKRDAFIEAHNAIRRQAEEETT